MNIRNWTDLNVYLWNRYRPSNRYNISDNISLSASLHYCFQTKYNFLGRNNTWKTLRQTFHQLLGFLVLVSRFGKWHAQMQLLLPISAKILLYIHPLFILNLTDIWMCSKNFCGNTGWVVESADCQVPKITSQLLSVCHTDLSAGNEITKVLLVDSASIQ